MLVSLVRIVESSERGSPLFLAKEANLAFAISCVFFHSSGKAFAWCFSCEVCLLAFVLFL